MQPICTKNWVTTNLIQTRAVNNNNNLGRRGHHMHAQPIQRCNNHDNTRHSTRRISALWMQIMKTMKIPCCRDTNFCSDPSLSLWRYLHLLLPCPLHLRGAYETPARVTKTTVLQYERGMGIGSRCQPEPRMAYRQSDMRSCGAALLTASMLSGASGAQHLQPLLGKS